MISVLEQVKEAKEKKAREEIYKIIQGEWFVVFFSACTL